MTPFIRPSRKDRTIGSENQSVVARGRGWEEWIDYRGVGGNFCSDGNTMLILVVVTRFYTFVKIHRTEYFQRVNFSVMSINLNTVCQIPQETWGEKRQGVLQGWEGLWD